MSRVLVTGLAVCLLSWAAHTQAQERPAPPPYRILVSHADGVDAAGLAPVAQVLQAIGDVHVAAPADARVRQAAGETPVIRTDRTLPNGLRAVALDASVTTVVEVAVQGLVPPAPDLVVLALHRGLVLGADVEGHPAMRAARVAASRGIPVIVGFVAADAPVLDVVLAAEEILGVARRVKQYGVEAGVVLSVNVPAAPPDGYRYAVTTLAPPSLQVYAAGTNGAGQVMYTRRAVAPPEGTDAWAVARGRVSVTPLRSPGADAGDLATLGTVFR